jgi:colicin import membrane protein
MVSSDRPQRPHRLRGKWLALALAIAVNLLFIGVLIFSVSWQNRRPEAVTAELYAPPDRTTPTPPVVPPPQPKPTPPEPKPVPPEPKPVTPPPKPPEPKVTQPDTRAADIALKAKKEAERKQHEDAERDRLRREAETEKDRMRKDAEARKQQEEKRQAERQQRDIAEMRAQAERETRTRVQAEREQQMRAQAEAETRTRAQQAEAGARNRAQSEWLDRIRSKIKGNVILPPELAGNPEAVFEVVQLPTGEIIDVQLRKSSGIRTYDDSVQRAILKSSPLPRPERAELFQRALTLRFRPVD